MLREVIFVAVISTMSHLVRSQKSGCVLSSANSNTASGIQIPNQNTLDLCTAACLAFLTNSTSCQYGFDFNKIDNTCWFSTNSVIKSAPNVDHYTCFNIPLITPGTCGAALANTNTNGGIVQPLANTLSDCMTACLANTLCSFGIDWNNDGANGLKCWFSTTLVTNLANGITHYYCLPVPNTTPALATVGRLRCAKFENSNSPGGNLISSTSKTITECISACYLVNNCNYGFDYTSTGLCWLNTNPTVNTGAVGVDHYQCLQPTTLSGDSGCVWSAIANTNTKNGQGQASYTTLDLCQAACLTLSSCNSLGFDWDPAATPKCWFSTTNISQTAIGVTHYICRSGISVTPPAAVTQKSDSCQWVVSKDRSTPGGIIFSNATSLAACQTICRANTLCLIFGFDWSVTSPVGSQCFISTNANERSNVGVDHYFWNCAGCPFTLFVDTFSPGGTLFNGGISLADCQNECIKYSDCWKYGMDWDPGNLFGEKCYLSVSNATLPAKNVTHYVPTCSPSGNATSPGTPTASNCVWNLILDKHSLGGTLISNALTLTDCQAKCQISNTCNSFGMDWDVTQPVGSQCYLSVNSDLVDAKNVAHYTYTCSATAPPTGGMNICSWSSRPNFQTIGGIKKNSSTLTDCQTECLKISTCSLNGIDFVPGAPVGSQCWISTNNAVSSIIGVDHWSYVCISTCTPVCSPLDNSSPGGTLKPTAMTEADCQTLCLAYRTQCIRYGYDWVVNGQPGTQCWLSTSLDKSFQTGVKHCSYENSGCVNPEASPPSCSWISANNINSPGGTLNSAITLDACQSACLSSASCRQYGFDFTADNKCWLSNNPTQGVFAGVKHYTYSCISGPDPTSPNCWWSTFSNQNSPGGIVQPSVTTEAGCRANCLSAINTCAKYGYDFNVNNNVGSQCWYSTSTSLGSLAGCNHYAYVCKGLTDIVTTKAAPSCSFLELVNINSPGGTLVPGATSVPSCQAECVKNVLKCSQFGFDWNPRDSTCFISTTTITGNAVGVSHYNYICTSSCNWVSLNDNNSPGGMLVSSALTLGQCQSLCSQSLTINCKFGFDWDTRAPQGGQCWFSSSTTTASFPGVVHYTCGSATTATTTTTAVPLTSKCGWNEYPGRILSTPAGDPKPSLTSKTDCWSNCVGTITCKAFEWFQNKLALPKCFFFYVNTLPDVTVTDSMTVHSIYFC